MARAQGTVVENSFVNGFITEATGLNFPQNALFESNNCTPLQTGPVERRLGIDFENNHSLKTIDRTGDAMTSYLWKNVGGSASLQLVVLQVGPTLFFYDGSTTEPLSFHPITASIALTDFSPSGFDSPRTKECQFADGNGLLFVANPNIDSFYVRYDSNTQTFTTERLRLKIRDFEGLDDGYEVDERPEVNMGSASNQKKYNLYNQGWETDRLNTWDSSRTDLPSNADVAWIFKNSSGNFDVSLVPKVWRGNSPAPKGHYILNLYNQDRGAASGITLSAVTIPTRASTIAFFAGRVFYGGIDYEDYNANIYFTQIIERDDQYEHCYQLNDPTSELLFDLLPTDGGVISIRECGNIIKMHAIGAGLAVFATNGVWLISGSTGLGFTANDYSVVKIAETSCLTSSSFVEVNGTMTWWNLEGIHTLQMEGANGKVISLTEPKIKTYYNSIPPAAKRRASGFYNGITGIIQWVYRETETETYEEYYEATKILNFNTNTGAFYLWTPAESDVKIHAVVVLEHRGGHVIASEVTDEDEETVLDGDGNPVTVHLLGDSRVVPKFKYIVSYADSGSYKFTVAEAWNTDYEDWASYEAVDAPAFFTSGYSVRGEANKDFQDGYFTFYTDNLSKFKVQGIWDFTVTPNSGRWSSSQIIDGTTDTNRYTTYRKLKIRGSGKAIQIKVTSLPGMPFNVIGWSANVNINTIV